jgi:DNA-binding NarL/FixJ family response regulator
LQSSAESREFSNSENSRNDRASNPEGTAPGAEANVARVLLITTRASLTERLKTRLATGARLALVIGTVPSSKTLVSHLLTENKAQVIAADADLFEQGTLVPADLTEVEGHSADVLLLFEKIGPQAVELCLASHAHGCLELDASAETFAHAVDAMAQGGELWFPRWMMEPFYEMALTTTTQGHAPDNSDLTEREAEALSLAQLGLTNKEIGVRLGISPHTAKKHLHNALIKHGIRRRRQLYR